MKKVNLLDGKRVLLVDDEVDVLESLVELLNMCALTTAKSFQEAKEFLETEFFDIAVLDIMGVDGYSLLEIAKERGIISVMLTAHAFNIDNTIQSLEKGADLYIPKDEISNIATYLEDVLEGHRKGRHSWWRWIDRLGPYYDKRFGSDWEKARERILETLKYKV